MAHPLTLTVENGEIHVQTTFQLDRGGNVGISIPIPNADLTIIEIQALACEQAAETLSKLATHFRSMSAKNHA